LDQDQELQWVLQARAGDQEAFAEIVKAYERPVYNLAYRMLGSESEAEDAAQETFIKVYSRLDTYDPERKFSSWILSVASHHCIDRLRRRKENAVSMEEIMAWRCVPDQKPKPEDRTLNADREREIRALLQQLPEEYRLLIILRYWHEYSYEEMSEITETTVSAVKSKLHRARKQMAEMMAEQKQVSAA